MMAGGAIGGTKLAHQKKNMVFFLFLHYVFIPIITSMFRNIIRNYVFLFEQVLQVIRFFAVAEESGPYQSHRQ